MKIVMLIEAGMKLAKRFGLGVKDIKHIHNLFKKNKEANDTPEGEYDYARLVGTGVAVLSIVFGILYAFGVINEEVYAKLLEVFENID